MYKKYRLVYCAQRHFQHYFNYIMRSVLLVEETSQYPEKTTDLPEVTDTLSHKIQKTYTNILKFTFFFFFKINRFKTFTIFLLLTMYTIFFLINRCDMYNSMMYKNTANFINILKSIYSFRSTDLRHLLFLLLTLYTKVFFYQQI